MSDKDIIGLKLDELKIKLDKRGTNKVGKKAALQDKLKEAIITRAPVLDIARESAGPKTGFALLRDELYYT